MSTQKHYKAERAHTNEFSKLMKKYNNSRKLVNNEIDTAGFFANIGGIALDEDIYIRDFNRVRIGGTSNKSIINRFKYESILNKPTKSTIKSKRQLVKAIAVQSDMEDKINLLNTSNNNNGTKENTSLSININNDLFKRNLGRNLISPMKDRPNIDIARETLNIHAPISRNKSCDFVNKIHRLITPRLHSPKMNSKIYYLLYKY